MGKSVSAFHVVDGSLHYQGCPVGESATKAGFESFDFSDPPLGEGASAVAFRVRHRRLNVEQVVKVYDPTIDGVVERASAEAEKNANPRLRGIVAAISDAGIYSYPRQIPYTIMEKVESVATLGEWLARRDSDWDDSRTLLLSDPDYSKLSDSWKESRKNEVFAEALNACAGFLVAVVRLQAAGVTHGDLNPGNVLFVEPSASAATETANQVRWEKGDRSRRYLNPSAVQAQPGLIKARATRIIDLGSSRLLTTNREVGVARDGFFVVDNTRKLLKPFFLDSGSSLRSWLNLEPVTLDNGLRGFRSTGTAAWVDPKLLAHSLLRLLCVASLLLGHGHSMRDLRTNRRIGSQILGSQDMADLNDLMLGEMSAFWSTMYDNQTLAVLKEISSAAPAAQAADSAELINWSRVASYFESIHPGLSFGRRISH